MNSRKAGDLTDSPDATMVLDLDDLAAVIEDVGLDRFLDDLIAAIVEGVGRYDAEQIEHQIRRGFSYTQPEIGLVEWMPTMAAGDLISIKTVGYHPENPGQRQIPSVLATTSLYDTTTGRLKLICESTVLTALRTGAASAVMTDALVRPGPITLGVVGCGTQAVTQIHAISRVRPLTRIVVTDVDPTNAASLQDRLPPGLPPVETADLLTFEHAVKGFDVLCTCTSVEIGKGPVLEIRETTPGLHINAVGSDFPGKVEIPIEHLRSSVVITDIAEQCLIEGEAQQLEPDELGPDMVSIMQQPDRPELIDQLTVFDSTGWSYEDLIAARLFMAHAERLGLGIRIRLEPGSGDGDPYDPYAMLRSGGGQP